MTGVTLRVASGQQLQGYSVQLVQHQGSVKGNSTYYAVLFLVLYVRLLLKP